MERAAKGLGKVLREAVRGGRPGLCYRRVASREGNCWEPMGQVASRTSGCSWVAVHDLFHHQPGEKGLLWEELATLGAEYYVNLEPLDGERLGDKPAGMNALMRNAEGIVAQALNEAETLDANTLVLPAMTQRRITGEAKWVFRAAATASREALKERIEGLSGVGDAQRVIEAFDRPGAIEDVIAWGYRQAVKRYGCQSAVRKGFDDALRRMKLLEGVNEGTVVHMMLAGCEASITTAEGK